MLVNEHTLSAGEMVAAFAQENGLARIVGTRTGGQVLGCANFPVGHAFVLRFPAAGWYTWRGAIVEAMACNLMSMCLCHQRGFGKGRTTSLRQQSRQLM